MTPPAAKLPGCFSPAGESFAVGKAGIHPSFSAPASTQKKLGVYSEKANHDCEPGWMEQGIMVG